MTKFLAVTNDWHSGHRLGLLNPQVELQGVDELGNIRPYQPKPTVSQEYLWDLYTHDIDKIAEITAGYELTVALNGDATQGNKYPGNWVSTRMSDQILIAAMNAEPWFKLPNLAHFKITIGTEAHNFGEGSSELLLQTILQRTYPEIDTQVMAHGLLHCDQVVFDYAHHGPNPGSRTWLSGNMARFYLRDLIFREILSHRRPPDVVLRAHYHSPVHEVLEVAEYTSELFVVPSYCMADDHTRQATQSLESVTNGMVLFQCDGDKFDYQRMYATIDTRTTENV